MEKEKKYTFEQVTKIVKFTIVCCEFYSNELKDSIYPITKNGVIIFNVLEYIKSNKIKNIPFDSVDRENIREMIETGKVKILNRPK